MHITHIRYHTSLSGPLSKANDDQLLIGSVLEISELHKKHHVNNKGLKKVYSITWQQAKESIGKCSTYSLYTQTSLPARSNPKGTQRYEI